MAFIAPLPLHWTTRHSSATSLAVNPRPLSKSRPSRARLPPKCAADSPPPDDVAQEEERRKLEDMRRRLEGLFGAEEDTSGVRVSDRFDGVALRKAIKDRWSVQYDIQPQKRNGRVYVQIMWRYFEQQSFYMEEDVFASHCEAVAQLLQRWDAVDYFCDYIASVKKRPVVGLTINIPIPNIDANTEFFE